MLRLRNVGVFDERLRHNMTAGKATGTYKMKLRPGAAFLCLFFGFSCDKSGIKKSPHKAGKITGFYRGFLHRDITQLLDGSTLPNALYGFVIAR